MKVRSKKGFSLVELIIVIAILGIIAVVAVPNLMNTLNSSKVKADMSTAAEIGAAAQIAYAENALNCSTWTIYSSAVSSAYISGGYKPTANTAADYYVKTATINGATHIVVGIGESNGIDNEQYTYGEEGIAFISGYTDLATGITALGGTTPVTPGA